jgi:ribonuclease G
MAKELIVSVNGREKKIAIVEDDAVTEFYVERGDENQGIVGNIYKGRVMKVLPGMQSAFVDIGLERDAFLYVSDFIEEEDEDGAFEDRKEPALPRPAAPAPKLDPRPRPPRFILPEPVEAADEAEEELQAVALRHIKEITEEPVIEPADDEEPIELGVEEVEAPRVAEAPAPEVAAEPDIRRQRRQRRLRYTEPEEAPAAAELPPPVVEVEAEAESAADSEQEDGGPGRRRRRSRRKRGGETVESAPAPVEAAEQVDEEAVGLLAEAPAVGSVIVVHHDPLERIIDDEEGIEGEMLKDAMLQEKISGRIHAEELQASILEVDPTPEVTVGSLRRALLSDSDFERISDDEPEAATPVEARAETPKEKVDESEAETPAASIETVESAEAEAGTEPEAEAEAAQQKAAEASDDEVTESAASETETNDEEPLADASAELRQRLPHEEMATRRGGRGRRRFQRPPVTDATGNGEEDRDDGEEAAEAPAPAAPSYQRPLDQRPLERFHRPVISDLLREGQEILVQIAKEPIGQKGARITSHIALPGRYIVYMPTVEHIGVSRKIGTDEERQRLRRTLHQLRGETGAPGGFIVRTAAHGCTTEELRDDMQYLIRTWTDIRRRSERAKSPAIIHRDLDLVQRILRDQLSSDFNAIRVDNEFEYERIVDFVNRFAPKLVHRVKLYTKDTPILEEHGVQPEIDKAVKPRVWLKSGGYIVINQTEALVAIDVNTGKFVGKSNRLEDTIVKTNLEAAKEIVRQIRLRDLGGIIVLDFIDMEERRNRMKVMQALEQELRNDRSPSKILQFNDFGLVAVTRKRVKQSLERTLCTPCPYCTGGGMVKSPQTICYEILAEARRVSKDVDSHNEVILRVNPEVAKVLRTTERDVFTEIESYLGGVVTIKSDAVVHQEQFDIALV